MILSTEPLPTARRRRSLLLYLGLAYAGMWLAMSPLLAGGFQRGDARQDTGALEQTCISAAMLAPALAALVAVRWAERSGRVRETLALRWPRPWGRAVSACLAAFAVPAGLTVAALTIGTLAGSYPFGGVHWSGLGAWAAAAAGQMLLSLPLFFGEELGWQGYLFPRLARDGGRLGLVGAYLVTGTAFALWHLPTLLMGGQYPGRPWYVSVPAMLVSCVLILPVFTWLRLRSGSVVPAVIGHAFISSVSVVMVKEFADPAATLDPLHMGINGWPGWIVLAAFVAFLTVTGRLRPSSYVRPGPVRAAWPVLRRTGGPALDEPARGVSDGSP
ncbi:CPBP family intramembrane glutamic endopeptidase [Streptomyces pinistramenti]|uniref:CPBP family intramembrane glutamic endopeptidase n=1 Tax=Streptomyces pinistramenti TaxID=2884812 RepID=UPI001D0690EC|nr:CPBP family intramembrane glutamic endopeptidase [Streptomyces pinistramenti]MCB5906804.1 CPBP family intramembrane metalloprotease [Streptomyces pinistramenti]